MNRKRAFFIPFVFFAIFFFSLSAHAQTWTAQTSGTGSHLRGISFINANTGWVVGLDGTILKTTNGGTTWTAQTSNATSGLAIYFIDANTGWMSGLYGTLRKTTDGGTNWTTLNPGTTGHLYALYFIDANNGWIGGISGATAVLRETTDGGTNWSARTASNPGQISDFHFYDANIGWGVNNGGSGIMKTTNGNTWSDQTGGSTQYKVIQFVDANTGWVMGLSGLIRKTTNGGTNWIAQTSGTTNPLYGGYVVDANNAYAVGLSGTVRKTIDGTNWTGEDPGTTSSLYGAYFIDANTGWVVGDSGTIRKRTLADTTAPADITNLSAGSTTTSTVSLSWTAPGDDGSTGTATTYDIRYSTEVITAGNFGSATQVFGELSPQIAGTSQSMTVTGLTPSSLYYFAMKTSDEVPNTSGISNVVGAVTAAVTNPAPTTTSISPTSKLVGDAEFTLTVNGTNFIASSTVRFEGSGRVTTYVNATQLTATIPASDLLSAGTFSITVYNPPLGGGISNSQTFTVNTAPDTTAPADITNLSAGSPTSTTLDLAWTAPGDDGSTGIANAYDIRYSTSMITADNFGSATQVTGEPVPQVAGTLESMTLAGLSAETTYYFAMKTSDEVPNTSGISNVASGTTLAGGVTPPPPPGPTPPPASTGGIVVPDYITIRFSGRAYPGAQLTVLMQELGRETISVQQDTVTSSDGTFAVEFNGLIQAKIRQYGIAISDKDGRVALSRLFATAIVEEDVYTQTIFASPTLGFSQSSAVVKDGKLNIVGYATPKSRVEISIDGAVRRDVIAAGDDGFYRASLSVEGLDYGTHTIFARQFDAEGTPSDFSPTQFFTVSRLVIPQADLNGDGKINVSDFSIFLTRWASSDSAVRSRIDLNADGKVNISDFSVLVRGIRAQ